LYRRRTENIGDNPSITTTDNVGNTIGSTGTFDLDDVAPAAPTCTTTPTPASNGTAVTTTCTGVETDAVITIDNMTCGAEAGNQVVCTGTVGTGVGEITVPNDTVTITDVAGNTDTTETTGLDIDNNLPVVTINTPAAINAATDETTYAVTGTCENADGNVTVSIPGATPATQSVTCAGTDTWSAVFDTTALAESPTAVVVDASQTDGSGNTGNATQQTAAKDETVAAPACTTVPNPANNGTNVTTTCTGVETGAVITIDNMTCGAEAGNQVVCTGTIGTGVGEITVPNDTVTITDAAGNTDATASTGLVIDNSLPVVTINTPTDINNATDETAYTVTGTCENAEGNVTVLIAGATPATQNVTCTGADTWTASFDTTAIADGAAAIVVDANQTDGSGNTGNASQQTAAKDTDAPTASTAPDLIAADDSGTLNNDDITFVTAPSFTIACTDPNTVTLFVNGVAAGTDTCNAGTVTIASTETLVENSNLITTTQTDAGGNQSAPSPSLDVTLDTTPSAAPTITAPAGTPTMAAAVTVEGACVDTEIVSISNANLTLNPTNTTCNAGTYSATVTFQAAANNTTQSLNVIQTDIAGNPSPATSTSVDIDMTPPGIGSTDALLTNDNTPALSGTLSAPTDAADTIEVEINGNTYPATNNGDGTWDIADNVVAFLPDNLYNVTVTVTDPAGNAAPNTDISIVEIDTMAPAAPTVDTQL